MRQGWKRSVCKPVFAPHLMSSELCGIIGDAPESVIPMNAKTFAPIIADVTGIILARVLSDGLLARACSCAWIYARARHSGQTLSGCPPGSNSRPQLMQVAMHELYTSEGRGQSPANFFGPTVSGSTSSLRVLELRRRPNDKLRPESQPRTT